MSRIILRALFLFGGLVLLCSGAPAQSQDDAEIRINTAFSGGSLGTVEVLAPTVFRCHIAGQYDQRGHNRQASWFYFRMENVEKREITLTFTDYVGEYNDRPGACPMNGELRPVWSENGSDWRHFESMNWDAEKREATVVFTPQSETVWIAHTFPYPWTRIEELAARLDSLPCCRVERFGETVEKRPLYVVTITDESVPASEKRHCWFMPRQHAWESPTSLVGEELVRFLVSDDPEALELRRKLIFRFVPTLDPDGCHDGGVRFNRNGYDTNRHWNRITSAAKEEFTRTPELASIHQAILAAHQEKPIDLFLALHNEENHDHWSAGADGDALKAKIEKFYDEFCRTSAFDPTDSAESARALRFCPNGAQSVEALWERYRIPTVLIEFKIGPNKRLGRLPTDSDYAAMGPPLLRALCAAFGD